MCAKGRMLLTASTAVLVSLVLVATASAGHIRRSKAKFKDTWSSLELRWGTGTVRCPVRVEGSFHSSTFAKVSGALIGYIYRATRTGNCTGGRATIDQESLPWHVAYGGFAGTLPNITGDIFWWIKFKVTTESTGLTCTTRTESGHPFVGRENIASGRATSFTADESALIPLSGGFLCSFAGEGSFAGTATTTDEVEGSITITLI